MMKNEDTKSMITVEEADILQEIMNIAFGRAASDLAECIDIFVVLSTPKIKLVRVNDLAEHLNIEIRDFEKVSVVQQNFWGKFKGNAFLVFPADAGTRILSLFQGIDELTDPESNFTLVRETFLEIGNILIGACIGKIAELLGDVATYSPPHITIEKSLHGIVKDNMSDPDSLAIILKTVFEFNEKNVSGYMFIITKQESFSWLKAALRKFVDQFE
ncbi:MAG: chemotaxis protein CheC [Smithella sp.]|nr:chemotaxis protein CheC [Smithella sp.]